MLVGKVIHGKSYPLVEYLEVSATTARGGEIYVRLNTHTRTRSVCADEQKYPPKIPP